MKTFAWAFAVAQALIAFADAQDQVPPPTPTWQDKIAKGFIPYHQLTVDDFKIDDAAHPESDYWVKPFLHPHWHYFIKPYGDWVYAYVDQWLIFSGLDKNESSRKSKFRGMKQALPFAQAYLDILEIHARHLAALKPGELPSARAAPQEEAQAALRQNLDAFLKVRFQLAQAETEVLMKATNRGANRKKVLELAKQIRERLDALPPPTNSPTPSETPASSAAPKPIATPPSG